MATLSTFFDMVYVQVSGSPGAGNATLGSALIGFQTPAAAGITNGTPVSYKATDGINWETAHGTINVSGSTYTLVRGVDTIKSSNSNALVSFGAGVTVAITELSQDLNAFVSAGAAQSFSGGQQLQALENLGIGGAWSAYTPTFTPVSGAWATATATGRYTQMGKTVNFVAHCSVSAIGTGAGGAVLIGLPVAASAADGACTGVDARVGKTMNCPVAVANPPYMYCRYYDGGDPIANGGNYSVSGTYDTV